MYLEGTEDELRCLEGGKYELGIDFSWDGVRAPVKKKANKSGGGFGSFSIGSGKGDGAALVIGIIIVILVLYGLWAGIASLISPNFKFGFILSGQYVSLDELERGGSKYELPQRRWGFRTTVMLSNDLQLGMFFQLNRTEGEYIITEPDRTKINEDIYGYAYSWGLGFIQPSDKSGFYLYGQAIQDEVVDNGFFDQLKKDSKIDFQKSIYSGALVLGYSF